MDVEDSSSGLVGVSGTKGGVSENVKFEEKWISLGLAERYDGISWINRHLCTFTSSSRSVEISSARNRLTHSSPNSQTLPLASLQQRSRSSLCFPHLRPLFAPRFSFLCSLLVFRRESLSSRGSESGLPAAWFVLPSTASSSAGGRGAAWIRNLCVLVD